MATSMIPPGSTVGACEPFAIFWRGFWCFLAMFRPVTTTLPGATRRSTLPRFPASLPLSTETVSPTRISVVVS